jgi:hypothetical protein
MSPRQALVLVSRINTFDFQRRVYSIFLDNSILKTVNMSANRRGETGRQSSGQSSGQDSRRRKLLRRQQIESLDIIRTGVFNAPVQSLVKSTIKAPIKAPSKTMTQAIVWCNYVRTYLVAHRKASSLSPTAGFSH